MKHSKMMALALALAFTMQVKAQEVTDTIDITENTDSTFITPEDTVVVIDSLALMSPYVDVLINHPEKKIKMHLKPKYQIAYFTEDVCDSIYADMTQRLPDSLRQYRKEIFTQNHPIEDYVPNYFRKHLKKDDSRLWKQHYKGHPWVKNISQHATTDMGLENTHIALWQSHGRYYKNNDWWWQRPRLFCTTEDLLTQTFVIPYIIPMLENAGAVVYTPRERDWQSNEVIVDNDSLSGGKYMEHTQSGHVWSDTGTAGFAHLKDIYQNGENPFLDGTARQISTTSDIKKISSATWIPNIPEKGRYAVYVSYQTVEGSIDNAQYCVHHKGGETHFEVNQQMGGETWVYLGQFEFDKGESVNGCVELSNYSKEHGVITADAVRFGGGMGNISRGKAGVSGLPRWAEAAKYSLQWAGFNDSICNKNNGRDDYNDDLYSRPSAINELCGGSVFSPDKQGRHVPFELSLAFHSDAGFSREDNFTGSLAISVTQNEKTGATTNAGGISRFANYDLASIILHNLHNDLRKYDWTVRGTWDKDYCETREPDVPSAIVEMFSHQNFSDMRMAYNPEFKFDLCRSIYKSVVKYVATTHHRDYVIQPLPVKNFRAILNLDKNEVNLSWEPTTDVDEPTARPERYIVYTRVDSAGFDNGRTVSSTFFTAKQEKGHIYSYKVVAMNKGGISFPSKVLATYISPESSEEILLADATTLEGPAEINDYTTQGFLLNQSKGLQYGIFPGFCGAQKVFDKSRMGNESSSGLGFSGSELEGVVIQGNSYDNIYPQIISMLNTNKTSFSSAVKEAVKSGKVNPNKYTSIEFVNNPITSEP